MGTAGAEQLRQRLAQGLAARPVLREALRALGAGGFSFVLAGAGFYRRIAGRWRLRR